MDICSQSIDKGHSYTNEYILKYLHLHTRRRIDIISREIRILTYGAHGRKTLSFKFYHIAIQRRLCLNPFILETLDKSNTFGAKLLCFLGHVSGLHFI